MKKILAFLFISISTLSVAFAQSGKDDLITALKKADSEQFVRFFDNTLDVKLPNSDEMKGVQKAQASSTIKSFFSTNNITALEVTSQRELGGTMYVTGKLQGTATYNLTVMAKSTGDKVSIITIRINN